jgi:hypothetical protein
MKVGDLVRPRSAAYKDQMGIVISIGWSSVVVRRICGKESRYNKGSLEVISEGR